tara:strand:+ start:578 stop:1135 length:558 start_codon:yes stop_codon:yes gene_type:complete
MSFNSSNNTNITAPSPSQHITEHNATFPNITAPSSAFAPSQHITEHNSTFPNITAPSSAFAPSPINPSPINPSSAFAPSSVFAPSPINPSSAFAPSPINPSSDTLTDHGFIIPQIAAVLFVCLLIIATVFRKKIHEMAKTARDKYMSHHYISIDHLPDILPEIDVTAEIEMVPEIDVEVKQENGG